MEDVALRLPPPGGIEAPGIELVAVIGAGQMGLGVAQVLACSGVSVLLFDVSVDVLDKGIASIEAGLARLASRKKMTEKAAADAIALIDSVVSADGDYSRLADADLVIEAVPELMPLKEKVLSAIVAHAGPRAIIASNTSSISMTALAAVVPAERRPTFAGLHFFNPVPVMSLVEVIKGLETSDRTVSALLELCTRMGKQGVECLDSPGFVVNRLLVPMLNEAIFAVFEGVASPSDIDRCMKLGANHPMGPLALCDMIGLDTILSVMEVLHREFGDDKYRACPLLRKMVAAGRLGRKAGRGFYDYSGAKL
jgi:3-hydroxybutyryl-CoA dehydrogenase